MSAFSVPTIPLSVEVWCKDGRRLLGDVFMPAQSAVHQGQMKPEEWANSVAMFFPFRPYSGGCRMLLNRRQVIAFSIPSSTSPEDELEAVTPRPCTRSRSRPVVSDFAAGSSSTGPRISSAWWIS